MVSLGGPLQAQITLPKPNLVDHTLTHGSVCSSPVPGDVGLVSTPVLNGSLRSWLFIIVTVYILLVLYYLHCLYTLLILFVIRLKINHITSCNDCTVPDHDGGRPKQINAWFLYTHMVYL